MQIAHLFGAIRMILGMRRLAGAATGKGAPWHNGPPMSYDARKCVCETPTGSVAMTDYDSPWKEALEVYFQAFLTLFFPHIHADIDWSRGHIFLDKELQKIAPKAARGRLYVDKLVKVWRKDGREAWVLIHVEVQTQRDPDFPARMYGYNTRLADRYNRKVVSLAVLADDNPDWRPEQFEDKLWGWSVRMGWPTVKVLDYTKREAELERSENPFAKLVLAHLKALETRKDPSARRTWKFRLVRGLYERGFSSEDVRQLLRVIDWLLDLPPRLQAAFRRELDEYEEGQPMPFVTSFERGGMLKVIEASLRTRFGAEGIELMPTIADLDDAEKYLALSQTIITAPTLNDVRRAIAKIAAPAWWPRKGGNGKRGSAKT
jgi:hypothetical protein